MRSSSAEAPRLADRAGWTRLGVAVLLGVVAAAAPVVGQTSAQFTDTSEVALVSVGTPDDFASPTPSASPDGTDGATSTPGTPATDGTDGVDGPAAAPARPSDGPGPTGPSPLNLRPRIAPWAR